MKLQATWSAAVALLALQLHVVAGAGPSGERQVRLEDIERDNLASAKQRQQQQQQQQQLQQQQLALLYQQQQQQQQLRQQQPQQQVYRQQPQPEEQYIPQDQLAAFLQQHQQQQAALLQQIYQQNQQVQRQQQQQQQQPQFVYQPVQQTAFPSATAGGQQAAFYIPQATFTGAANALSAASPAVPRQQQQQLQYQPQQQQQQQQEQQQYLQLQLQQYLRQQQELQAQAQQQPSLRYQLVQPQQSVALPGALSQDYLQYKQAAPAAAAPAATATPVPAQAVQFVYQVPPNRPAAVVTSSSQPAKAFYSAGVKSTPEPTAPPKPSSSTLQTAASGFVPSSPLTAAALRQHPHQGVSYSHYRRGRGGI